MRILIVLNEDNNLNSKLGYHFGRSPFFAIYDTNTKDLKIIKNIIDHSKEQTPIEQVLKFNIDSVYTQGMGQKAFDLFKEKNISVKSGNYETLKEVIDNINNLEDIQKPKVH